MGVYVNDPRFDGWDTVRAFDDVSTARAFEQQLKELGIDAVITADHPPDRHGRGDVYLCVPPGQAIEAQEMVDFPQDEDDVEWGE